MFKKMGINFIFVFIPVLLLILFCYINYIPFSRGRFNLLDFFISLTYLIGWIFLFFVCKQSKDYKSMFFFTGWWSVQTLGIIAYLLLPLFQEQSYIDIFPYRFYPFVAPMSALEFAIKSETITMFVLIAISLIFTSISLLLHKKMKKDYDEMQAIINAVPRKRKYGYVEE